MSDTEDSADRPSSGWALVNRKPHLLGGDQDDTSSTTSSVEVVDEDDDFDDEVDDSGTPLARSPASPGPLFVLRLPSHNPNVSDTEEDTASSEQTDGQETESLTATSVTEPGLDSFNLLHPQPGVSQPVSSEDLDALCRTLDSIKDRVASGQLQTADKDSQTKGENDRDQARHSEMTVVSKESVHIDENPVHVTETSVIEKPVSMQGEPVHIDEEAGGINREPDVMTASTTSSLSSTFSFVPREGTDREEEALIARPKVADATETPASPAPFTTPADDDADDDNGDADGGDGVPDDDDASAVCAPDVDGIEGEGHTSLFGDFKRHCESLLEFVCERPKFSIAVIISIAMVSVVIYSVVFVRPTICVACFVDRMSFRERELYNLFRESTTNEADIEAIQDKLTDQHDLLQLLSEKTISMNSEIQSTWLDIDLVKLRLHNKWTEAEGMLPNTDLAFSADEVKKLERAYGVKVVKKHSLLSLLKVMNETEKENLIFDYNKKVMEMTDMMLLLRKKFDKLEAENSEIRAQVKHNDDTGKNRRSDLLYWMDIAESKTKHVDVTTERLLRSKNDVLQDSLASLEREKTEQQRQVQGGRKQLRKTIILWNEDKVNRMYHEQLINRTETLERDYEQCKHKAVLVEGEKERLKQDLKSLEKDLDDIKKSQDRFSAGGNGAVSTDQLATNSLRTERDAAVLERDSEREERGKVEQLVTEKNREIRELQQTVEDQKLVAGELQNEVNMKTVEVSRLEKKLSACEQSHKHTGANSGSPPNWEACKILMAEIYEKQSSNMNAAWKEMRDKVSEFAGTYLPDDVYTWFQLHGLGEQSPPTAPETEDKPGPSTEGLGGQSFQHSSQSSKQEGPSTGHQSSTGAGNQEEVEQHADWADSVFEMMNKTRGQFQHTWEKVKNMSDNLWNEHSPTIQRLHNSFSEKLNHLSKKFHQKLSRKVNKWFKTSQKKDKDSGQFGPKEENKQKGNKFRKDDKQQKWKNDNKEQNEKAGDKTVKTKRREFKNDKVNGREIPLRETIRSVESLNARKYKKLVNKGNDDLLQLKSDIIDTAWLLRVAVTGSPVQAWWSCQADWWSDGSAPTHCLPHLCCWQVKVTGDKLMLKACHQQKKQLNLDEGQCFDLNLSDDNAANVPSTNSKERKHADKKSIKAESDNGGRLSKGDKPVQVDSIYVDEYKPVKDFDNLQQDQYRTDTVFDEFDTDGGNSGHKPRNANFEFGGTVDENDGEDNSNDGDYDDDDDDDDEDWYSARMEDREYRHKEPDDWFFRRGHDRDSENIKLAKNGDKHIEQGWEDKSAMNDRANHIYDFDDINAEPDDTENWEFEDKPHCIEL